MAHDLLCGGANEDRDRADRALKERLSAVDKRNLTETIRLEPKKAPNILGPALAGAGILCGLAGLALFVQKAV
ncbi:hypothetical protein ABTM91_20810, partial [Acinetobacter baumannii]